MIIRKIKMKMHNYQKKYNKIKRNRSKFGLKGYFMRKKSSSFRNKMLRLALKSNITYVIYITNILNVSFMSQKIQQNGTDTKLLKNLMESDYTFCKWTIICHKIIFKSSEKIHL